MENINKLFETNKVNITNKSKVKPQYINRNGIKHLYKSGKKLNSKEIKKMINFVNQELYDGYKISVFLDFSNLKMISDKLSYILLECICYYIITSNRKVELLLNDEFTSVIYSDGFDKSCLLSLTINSKKYLYSTEEFLKRFKFELHLNHYRRMVNYEDYEKPNYLGQIQQEIITFTKTTGVDENNAIDLAQVSIELIGNALEHTKSSCIVDIDVSAPEYKKIDDEGEGNYYSVNLCVVNFSDLLFGNMLNDKMEKIRSCLEKDNRYKKYGVILKAYNNHKKFFDEKYNEELFYILASLQNNISGSMVKDENGGGKGMTCLIKSLENQSDDHICYLLSGYNIFAFHSNLIKLDKNKWIGFNENNNFVEERPDDKCFDVCKVYMPGTAYNLTFIFKA